MGVFRVFPKLRMSPKSSGNICKQRSKPVGIEGANQSRDTWGWESPPDAILQFQNQMSQVSWDRGSVPCFYLHFPYVLRLHGETWILSARQNIACYARGDEQFFEEQTLLMLMFPFEFAGDILEDTLITYRRHYMIIYHDMISSWYPKQPFIIQSDDCKSLGNVCFILNWLFWGSRIHLFSPTIEMMKVSA